MTNQSKAIIICLIWGPIGAILHSSYAWTFGQLAVTSIAVGVITGILFPLKDKS